MADLAQRGTGRMAGIAVAAAILTRATLGCQGEHHDPHLLGARDGSHIDDELMDGSMPSDSSSPPVDDGAFVHGVATFRARLENGRVMIDFEGVETIGWLTCSGQEPVLEKRVGEQWLPLQDDRPPSTSHNGYYLDDMFERPTMNLGCDMVGCRENTHSLAGPFAHEFVKVTMRAPPAGIPSASNPADVIETRPFHGLLRARFKYMSGLGCTTDLVDASVELEIPDDGCNCEPDDDAGVR